MCGLFAAFNFGSRARHEAAFVRSIQMVDHRGPDHIGHFCDDQCFLGLARLAIVGLEQASNQPFFFENLAISFNGEIFNYIELRAELVKEGYKFETNSDTEVIIKAYHRWREACFERLNGMWAMVIYDRQERSITVSRDRFGQKPLFVMRRDGAYYFASEVQQLVPLSDGQVDYELIQMFLKEGTYQGHGRTFFKSIEEFPKAHYFKVNCDGTSSSRRFWDYWQGEIKQVEDRDFQEFTEILEDSIRIRLRADVPFGLLLSGGVDSTIVAAYARRFVGTELRIPAFTYASKDALDESGYAKRVADKLDLTLHVRVQDQDARSYVERLRKLVKHMGRGHSSLAIVSVDYLYESVAKMGVRVALDGQGADELLGGYKTYSPLLIPYFLLRGDLTQAYFFTRDLLRSGVVFTVRLFLRNVMPDFGKRIGRWLYGYERFFRAYQHSPTERIVVKQDDGKANRNLLNRYLIWYHSLGLENLLFYGDIVAMKSSVENRSPYLDHRLVDFVFSRSEKLKAWCGIDKYALRNLPLYNEFRAELEREKIGFASSVKLETKKLMIEQLRHSPILNWPIFSGRLAKFIGQPALASPKYETFLFRLFQVHLWNEEFRQGQNTANEPRVTPETFPNRAVA